MTSTPTHHAVSTLAGLMSQEIDTTLGRAYDYAGDSFEIADDRAEALDAIFKKYQDATLQYITVSNLSTMPSQAASGFALGKIFGAEQGGGWKSFWLTLLALSTGNAIEKGLGSLMGRQVAAAEWKYAFQKGGVADDKIPALLPWPMVNIGVLNQIIEDPDNTPQMKYIASRLKEGFTAATASGTARTGQALDWAATLAAAYHGYKRNNDSIGWGIAWFFGGSAAAGLGAAQGWTKVQG